MQVIWSQESQRDLDRLYQFLAVNSVRAAERALTSISSAPDQLLQFPRMGGRVEPVDAGEVRRLIIGQYELRYEIQGELIRVLRVFHTREDR